MNIISDTSSQTVVTSLANVTGGYNPFATSNELVTGLATKQDTLTANTNLLGVGSSISALDYGKITLNIPQYFPTSWANVASKPTDFQANWNTTVTNKPDLTVYNAWTKTGNNIYTTIPDGNVGVGTNVINASYKLNIVGNLNASALYIGGTQINFSSYQPIINTYTITGGTGGSFGFATGTLTLGMPTTYTALSIASLTSVTSILYKGAEISSSYLKLDGTNNMTLNAGIALTGTGKFSGDGSLLTALNYNNITNNALSFQTPLSKNVANQVSINLSDYSPTTTNDTRYLRLNGTNAMQLNANIALTGTGQFIGDGSGLTSLNYNNITNNALSFQTPLSKNAANQVSINLSDYSPTSVSDIRYLRLNGTNDMANTLNIRILNQYAIDIQTTDSTAPNCIAFKNNTTSYGFIGLPGTTYSGNYANNLFLQSTNAIIFNSGSITSTGTPRMIIMSGGHIGMGTTNALQKLHIRGATPTAMIRVETDTDAENQTAGIEFGIPSFTSIKSAKITSTSLTGNKSDLKFYTRNGTAVDAFNFMTLSSGGDLLLNSVNGVNLATTESRINANGSTLCGCFGGDTLLSSYWGVAVNINNGGTGDGGTGNAPNTKIPGTSSFTINTRTSTTSSGFDKTLFSVRNSGIISMVNGQWHQSMDGIGRFYFNTNGTTYFHSGNAAGDGFKFRSTAQNDIVSISDTGNIACQGGINVNNNGQLIFNNNIDDMRIKLWDGYGFGINSGVLRYNSGGHHYFYSANNLLLAKINSTGVFDALGGLSNKTYVQASTTTYTTYVTGNPVTIYVYNKLYPFCVFYVTVGTTFGIYLGFNITAGQSFQPTLYYNGGITTYVPYFTNQVANGTVMWIYNAQAGVQVSIVEHWFY